MDVVERLSVEQAAAGDLLASEHLHRYELAAAVAAGKRVLDLCCGVGYGSALLAATAREVVGVDRDPATIDEARRVFGHVPGLRFEQADAVDALGRPEAAEADLVVCFEGLEHLADPDAAVERLGRLAAGGAQVLVSVPNGDVFAEDNPFHVTTYGPDAARALGERLGGATVLHQFHAEGSLVLRGEPADGADVRAAHTGRGEPEYANHFLLLANLDAELEGLVPHGRAQVVLAPQFNRYMVNLEQANRELWRANNRLARRHRGTFDAAAAALVARTEREVAEARAAATEASDAADLARRQAEEWRAEAERWRDEAFAAGEWARRSEATLAALRARRVVRLGLAVTRHTPSPWRRS